MRKILSILLVLVLFVDILEYQILVSCAKLKIQKENKSQIQKGLSDDELTLIIPQQGKKEIFWFKKDKEFLYKRQMYDVVRIKNVGQEKHYYCICDKKEEKLMSDYNRMHKSRRSKYISYIRMLLFYQTENEKIGLAESNIVYLVEERKLPQVYLPVSVHPPISYLI